METPKRVEFKVKVLTERPRWGEEQFMHGVYTCDETLAAAMNIIRDNHSKKNFAPPEFGVETVILNEMPFDWVAHQKEVDSKS